ncbi:transcriptional regulator [Streptomyces sp. NBC_00841]|uniref:transcriptional regulator n=1 Tax=unclassified Streptomyces TaxID=2593676 RepID=UPI0022504721|nr:MULTISPECIES: transcriptional regulator [unclassified Streptomyces]MCX4534876.1 transcriptional regulator [Streptomyces sp. NBC_01669]WRZ99797.1 transcriptional regulator [Streptomyces sp. NBC_00841]
MSRDVGDFGRPPLAAENADLVERRLKEAAAGTGLQETLTIEWRTKPQVVQVIEMPLGSLYYNPGTHRIRAQRSFDPQRDRRLDEDPWSDESQSYLQHLLQAKPSDPSKRDQDFDELKQSLKDFRQNEPGLITPDGILVNGNTRAAALRELGVAYIRVGVLPDSCTWADINRVELSLQLRPDTRREYSYINRLLTIDEQVGAGRPLKEVAREFRIRESTAEQDLWVLTCLRDLRDRSTTGDAQLRLLDFEDAQEKLREVHRAYAKESKADPRKAELLKENRLAAIVMEFSKTDVRLIEADFRTRYLEHRLPDELKTAPAAAPERVIPGIGRAVKAEVPQVAAARAFTDSVLRAKAVIRARDKVSLAESEKAASVFEVAHKAVEDALEPAGKDARVRKRKQAAPDRLYDACQDIEQCITDMVLARGSRSLDEEALDEAVLKLRASLGKLALAAAQSIEVPGDGVAWLLEAARQEAS